MHQTMRSRLRDVYILNNSCKYIKTLVGIMLVKVIFLWTFII